MIDAKKIEELISRKTELVAETGVYIAIGDFISSNMDRCKSERKYSEWQAWIDAETAILNRIERIKLDLEEIREQIKHNR